jgi:hypothetical protein
VFVHINTVMRRQRRRLMVLAAMLVLAGTVTIAHSAMGGDHMGDGTAMCLAVLAVAAIAAVAAVAGASLASLPVLWAAPVSRELPWPLAVAQPEPRARAGPATLQVFRL